MIWTVAAVSVLLSVLFYQAVVIVERRVLRRLGMATASNFVDHSTDFCSSKKSENSSEYIEESPRAAQNTPMS
jgi:hypothetical protein